MKKLVFLDRKTAVFIKAIETHEKLEKKSILLVGDSLLTRNIEQFLANQDYSYSLVARLEKIIPDNTEIIIITENNGHDLSSELSKCYQFNGTILACKTLWYFKNKPLFLISIPKAGTHILYRLANLLGYKTGVEYSHFPTPGYWYCLEYSNSHTLPRDFFIDSVRRAKFGNRYHQFPASPTLFIYRHPLDILVSEAKYYHIEGNTTYSQWLGQYDFNERVQLLLSNNGVVNPFHERISAFIPWLDFPNVIPTSFEELVGSKGNGNDELQKKLIWSLLLKLQAPGKPDDIARELFSESSPTFRSGKIGNYDNFLGEEAINQVSTNIKTYNVNFGYPIDGTFDLSTKLNQFIEKPVQYVKTTYTEMPLAVEQDFMNCNLVLYNTHFYALPRITGPISINEIEKSFLAVIPRANTLSGLKSLLTIGKPEVKEKLDQLETFGHMLKEGLQKENDFYWLENKQKHLPNSLSELQSGYQVLSAEIDSLRRELEFLKKKRLDADNA